MRQPAAMCGVTGGVPGCTRTLRSADGATTYHSMSAVPRYLETPFWLSPDGSLLAVPDGEQGMNPAAGTLLYAEDGQLITAFSGETSGFAGNDELLVTTCFAVDPTGAPPAPE